jgi:hypothetical protein
MRVGSKSLLFGAHQFIIHPIFVAKAWTQLYGPARDPRLWIAFVIHDWGYWQKPNMDGPEGEEHVIWAAKMMEAWFGEEWGDFCLFHSRHYAKKLGQPYSRLCVADKLAPCLEPSWLYLIRVVLSGEIWEYLSHTDPDTSVAEWYSGFTTRMRAWVAEHQDLKVDTWTPAGGAHGWHVDRPLDQYGITED